MKSFTDGDCRQSDINPDGDVNVANQENEQNCEVFEEKFRVDRKKLELMLQGSNENNESAAHFFQRVMNETCTNITWPSKLKIGAKSKKDPHVKICGHPLAIKEARTQIKAALDTKTNQVTLKMDVSYSDHSHVIGKGGHTHKWLSAKTGCLIHFPDSNRNSMTEKNNQVSISGTVDGAEEARVTIRDLMPLVFHFEVPDNSGHLRLDMAECIQKLQTQDVQVQVKQSVKIDMGALISVRGSERNVHALKNAVDMLTNHFAIKYQMFMLVFMTIEISPRHLGEVEESCHELNIGEQTRTRITFPDVNMMGPATSKMTVTITGDFDGVYKARKLVLGCLPLMLLFDLNEDQKFDKDYFAHVKEKCGISISSKEKPKLNAIQITVKGKERNARDIYNVRYSFVKKEEVLEHPVNTFNPAPHITMAAARSTDLIRNANFPNLGFQNLGDGNLPLRPIPGTFTGGWNTSNSSNAYPLNFQENFYQLRSRLSGSSSLTESEGGYYSAPTSGTNSRLTSPSLSPRVNSPEDNYGMVYNLLPSSTGWTSSSYSNAKSVSTLFSQLNHNNSASSNAGLPTCIENVEMVPSNGPKLDDQLPEHQSNGLKPLVSADDYAKKKLLASKAMKNKPSEPEVRVPTNLWSGYGFSNSFPDGVIREQRLHRSKAFEHNGNSTIAESESATDKTPWNNSGHRPLNTSAQLRGDDRLTASNYADSFPHQSWTQSIGSCSGLAELLSHMGLEKYTQLFEQQDVDFTTFLTLTDADFRTLGIKTFGALKKMRQFIIAFNKEQGAFSPAPGAERRLSSSLSRSFSMRPKD